jgi:hypothetical protein
MTVLSYSGPRTVPALWAHRLAGESSPSPQGRWYLHKYQSDPGDAGLRLLPCTGPVALIWIVPAIMIADTPIVLRAGPDQFIELSGVERFKDGSGYAARLNIGSLGLGRIVCTGHPFYFDGLAGFTQEVTQAYNLVAGKARLGHRYEKDFIEIEVLKGGHVAVSGFITDHGRPQQELRFSFGCDQTFLPELLRLLKQVAGELERKA